MMHQALDPQRPGPRIARACAHVQIRTGTDTVHVRKLKIRVWNDVLFTCIRIRGTHARMRICPESFTVQRIT